MKRNQAKKHDQNVQTEQKDQPIIRVRSDLRAGLLGSDSRDTCI
jgi:hypothetical protein